MGILDKIEDKLHSSNKRDEPTTGLSADDYDSPATITSGAETSRQHPIGSSGVHGTGLDSRDAVGGVIGSGSGGSNVPGSFPGESNYGTNTTSDVPDRRRDDHTTTTTATSTTTNTALGHTPGLTDNNADRSIPRKTYDPYNSSGQQIATDAADSRDSYGASNNRGPAGDIGSRRDHDDPAVQHTLGAGVSSQLQSGPHTELENRDAIPTAGGEKIGTGAAYESRSQGVPDQHRDSGIAMTTTSRAGYHANEGVHGGEYTDASRDTTGPHRSNLLNKLDPRVENDPSKTSGTAGSHANTSHTNPLHSSTTDPESKHHDGRDTTLTSAAGALGAGATSHATSDREYNTGTASTSRSTAADPLSSASRNTTDGHHVSRTGHLDSSTATTTPRANDSSEKAGPHSSNLLNKLDPRVDSSPSSKTTAADNSSGQTVTGGGSWSSTRHAGYDDARRNHGGGSYGVGYEKGYEAGYRDALAHAETQRGGGTGGGGVLSGRS